MFAKKIYRLAITPWRMFIQCLCKVYFFLHGVNVESGLRMYSLPICRRHPKAVIKIGRDVSIYNKLRENLAGISHRTVLVANKPDAKLTIGNSVGISGAVIYCSNAITIEDYVNIGVGVRIYDTDFHPIGAVDRRNGLKDVIFTEPVRICKDSWIGSNAIILKGVTIGARSVIAAGAIVTKDIPPDTIAAGAPARPVRSLSKPTEI